jgi:hypothetical protein
MTAPRKFRIRINPASLRLVVFVVPAVAHKLETDSGIRIGLPVFEPAVEALIRATGLRLTELRLREWLGWMRTSLVRWVFATAELARIAVTANAVIRVFMTISLINIGCLVACARNGGRAVRGLAFPLDLGEGTGPAPAKWFRAGCLFFDPIFDFGLRFIEARFGIGSAR